MWMMTRKRRSCNKRDHSLCAPSSCPATMRVAFILGGPCFLLCIPIAYLSSTLGLSPYFCLTPMAIVLICMIWLGANWPMAPSVDALRVPSEHIDRVTPEPYNDQYIVLFAPGNGSSGESGALFSATANDVRIADLEHAVPGGRSWFEALDRIDVSFQPVLPLFDARICGVRPAHSVRDWNCGGEKDATLYANALDDLIAELDESSEKNIPPTSFTEERFPRLPPKVKLVLLGVSRGTSTVYNALTILSTRNVERWVTNIRPRIACALLFGAFHHVEDVVEARFQNIWGLGALLRYLMPRFTGYNEKWNPIHRTSLFPSNLPVLFVCSEKDMIVYWGATHRLFLATKEKRPAAAEKSVRYLMLKDVGHDFNYAQGLDLKRLHVAVHDILKETL